MNNKMSIIKEKQTENQKYKENSHLFSMTNDDKDKKVNLKKSKFKTVSKPIPVII